MVPPIGLTVASKHRGTSFKSRHRHFIKYELILLRGSGGGRVVSVLVFYSDNPSSNPAEDDNFSVKLYLSKKR